MAVCKRIVSRRSFEGLFKVHGMIPRMWQVFLTMSSCNILEFLQPFTTRLLSWTAACWRGCFYVSVRWSGSGHIGCNAGSRASICWIVGTGSSTNYLSHAMSKR